MIAALICVALLAGIGLGYWVGYQVGRDREYSRAWGESMRGQQ